MVVDIGNMRLGVDSKILVEINTDADFVDPNAKRIRSFLLLLTHQPRYISLNNSNWGKVSQDQKKKKGLAADIRNKISC